MKSINLFIKDVFFLMSMVGVMLSCTNEVKKEESETAANLEKVNDLSLKEQDGLIKELVLKLGEENLSMEKDSIGYLIELSVDFRGKSDMDSINMIFDNVNQLSGLESLTLKSITPDPDSVIKLYLPKLKTLVLDDLSERSIIHLKEQNELEALHFYNCLKVRVVNSNKLTHMGLRDSQVEVLNGDLSNLKTFFITESYITNLGEYELKKIEELDVFRVDARLLDNMNITGDLTRIEFDYVKNMHVLPEFIFQNKNLEYIHIRNCDLDSISPEISNLKQLKNCDLMLNGHIKNLIEIAKLPNISIFCADDIPENRKQVEEAMEKGYKKYFSPGECMQ